MFYTVRCYKNTGFNLIDIPASPALLDNCEYQDFPNINLVQNRGLVNIRIQSSFEDVKDIDYVKVGDTYYTLGAYPQMLNDNTCSLSLVEDYVTTMGGITNVKFKNVMVEYANVPDDSFGRWIKPETRWSPNQIIQVEQIEIQPSAGQTILNNQINVGIINSTIDLPKQGRTDECTVYTSDIDPDVSVQVPTIFPSINNTTIGFKRYLQGGTSTVNYTSTPSTYLYRMSETVRTQDLETGNWEVVTAPVIDIRNGIGKARQLGIESCILAQYILPSTYIDNELSSVDTTEGTWQYKALVPVLQDINNVDLGYKNIGYTARNNKIYYSNDWNKYVVFSMASGARSEFMPENLYNESEANVYPIFTLTADLRSTGQPICYPKYLYGKINQYMQNAIYGLNWDNAELLMYGASGQSRAYRDFALDYTDRNLSFRNSSVSNFRQRGNNFFNYVGDLAETWSSSNYSNYNFNNQMSALQNQFDASTQLLPDPDTGGYMLQSDRGLYEQMQGMYRSNMMNNGGLMLGLAKGFLNYSNMQGNLKQQQTFNEAAYNLANSRAAERYVWNNVIVSPSISFPHSDSMRDFFGNGFYCLKYKLSKQDAQEYDEFLDYFGYPVGEVSDTLDFFVNRKYFNYVSCSSMTLLEEGYTELERNGFKDQLTNCRLWKVLPKTWNKSMGNPISTETEEA